MDYGTATFVAVLEGIESNVFLSFLFHLSLVS